MTLVKALFCRHSFWLCLLSILAAPSLPAQNDTALYGRSYALVVGIDDYAAEKWRDLREAVNDARGMAAYLEREGFAVTTLYNGEATRERIISVMQNQFAQVLQSNDRVLIYFAGHGHTEPLGGEDWGYLVPADATNQSSSYISMEELQTLSRKMGNAVHQLFIMDACYGGLLALRGAENINMGTPNYLREITRRPARQMLTAGGKNQTAFDGLFTRVVLEALRDRKGDLNNDGYITFSELKTYAEARASNNNQTPAAASLQGHGLGEFVFAARDGLRIDGALPDSGTTRGGQPTDTLPGNTPSPDGIRWRDYLYLFILAGIGVLALLGGAIYFLRRRFQKKKTGGGFVTRERNLEGAMPDRAQLGRETEVKVMVSRADSKGLRAELPVAVISGDLIRKKDVIHDIIPLQFPLDENSEPVSIDSYLTLQAPDFGVEMERKKIRISPFHDSGVITFFLTAIRTDDHARVLVELLNSEESVLGSLTLMTRIVEADAPLEASWQLEAMALDASGAPLEIPEITPAAGEGDERIVDRVIDLGRRIIRLPVPAASPAPPAPPSDAGPKRGMPASPSESGEDSSGATPAIRKILFLNARPGEAIFQQTITGMLEVGGFLEIGGYSEQITTAVQRISTSADLLDALQKEKPHILHFSARGEVSVDAGIILADFNNGSGPVAAADMATFFRDAQAHLECVVLNECYSPEQAGAIAGHVPVVIGMDDALTDEQALVFLKSFYEALAAGKSYRRSYDLGCDMLRVAKIAEDALPDYYG